MARPEPEAAPAGAQSVRAGLVDGGGEVRQRGSQLHEDVRRQAGHHLGRGGAGTSDGAFLCSEIDFTHRLFPKSQK